jgi:hypothetical protein
MYRTVVIPCVLRKKRGVRRQSEDLCHSQVPGMLSQTYTACWLNLRARCRAQPGFQYFALKQAGSPLLPAGYSWTVFDPGTNRFQTYNFC